MTAVLKPFNLMWFVSGVVLHFVPFRTLTNIERLAALPRLYGALDCCLSALQAADLPGLQVRTGV